MSAGLDLGGLLSQIAQHGAIRVVTTRDGGAVRDHAELDAVTTILLDGDVVMRCRSGADLEAHFAAVRVALAPLASLRAWIDRGRWALTLGLQLPWLFQLASYAAHPAAWTGAVAALLSAHVGALVSIAVGAAAAPLHARAPRWTLALVARIAARGDADAWSGRQKAA